MIHHSLHMLLQRNVMYVFFYETEMPKSLVFGIVGLYKSYVIHGPRVKIGPARRVTYFK
jgi:hypothetical protein